jgi:hypothetical protein
MKLHLGALIIAVQSQIAHSYFSGNLQHRRSSGGALYGLSSAGKAEWAADDEGFSGFRDVSSQRKLNATFISNLVSSQTRRLAHKLPYATSLIHGTVYS